MKNFVNAFCTALAAGCALFAQTGAKPPVFDVKAHYTKYEYRIPMRDGVHLFTAVYVPKDSSQTYPILLNRTPYGIAPYGVDNYRERLGPSAKFDEAGYIFVFQDVRGRYLSEGKFVEMTPHIDHKSGPKDTDNSSDTYDTIEWLLKHVPDNNGKVGIWGISYPGFYTSSSIIDSHPALKAASPQAPMTDLFMGDDAYHGGAFQLAANFGFYVFFKPFDEPARPPRDFAPFDYKTPDGYEFFERMGPLANAMRYFKGGNFLWTDQVAHDTYDDYWKVRNLAPHLHNIHCAVMTVGGWFDAEDLAGPFKTYRAIEEQNPGITNILVVGPWYHGGWAGSDGDHLGPVQFNAKTAEFFRDTIQFPFFEQYLKGKGDANLPEAYVFETGTNVWRRYDAWPPKQGSSKMLYFRSGGRLAFDPPQAGEPVFDEYVSDPAKPVPFLDYFALGFPREYIAGDQRFASRRPDVLVYQTPELERDVTIAGPLAVKLRVSTTGTDSDFIVKLIDVYPDDFPDPKPNPGHIRMGGYQQLVRGEPMRGKFRHSFEKPEPFTPGKLSAIDFEMPAVNHSFRTGHRIMVQVQSTWFPLIDKNPQKFVDIPHASAADFQKATERIYHEPAQASGIGVFVLPGQ
jgi:putative CocE/NonD family hydrolase